MSVKVTKMNENQNNNNNSYIIVKKIQIAISPVLLGKKYPSGDQIQGFDASYPIVWMG